MRKLKRLPIAKRIAIVEITLNDIECNYMYNGICMHMLWAYSKVIYGVECDTNNDQNLSRAIPEFSIENARIISERCGLETPSSHPIPAYWWDNRNKKARVEFLYEVLDILYKKQSKIK